MKVQGDTLVPAMPALKGPTEQTYTLPSPRKTPERVFIGHGDGVASMRWDGQKWIDEGRLPKTVFEARSFAEDAAGDLWVGGSDNRSCGSKWRQPAWEPPRSRGFRPRRASLPARPM